MFEVGKDYLVSLVGRRPEDHFSERDAIWRVGAVEFPLIRFQRGDQNDWIVNVTSSHFIGAQIASRYDDEGNEVTSLPGEI
ncbi:hypothetical protein [Mesorhizobium mediterraneum]|uniref:hypothetical protein n=1 Tax=Mesorhizobium mediterraneum TaxID=43617 RepID=UPI001781DD42|nr:hypothetical protein [Mesorhizobium mediterraneum]